MRLYPNGRNWSLQVNWDDLGKLYAGFIIAWTIILGSGMLWLILYRSVPSVRIRKVGLSIAAVSFLHVYLVKIFLAYTTNGHFTCKAEFWIMSIYLPFGIALFQASTVQLESISEEQQSLLRKESRHGQNVTRQSRRWDRNLWKNWSAATAAERTYVYIGVGMLIQLVITGVIYATSPTLQGNWSSYGRISHAAGQLKCRRSLDWIPSAFWQLFWTWVFLTVISGLPGVPLWLAAVYAPPAIMKRVNKWWVPPMWLAPGIIVMQAVTIFVPIYEMYKDRAQLRRTLGILKTWEDSRRSDENQSMSNSTSLNNSSFASSGWSKSEKRVSMTPDPARRKTEMYTMAALEKALAVNPQPLLHFAATQDFTAENIVFLMQVRRWHAEWDRAITRDPRIKLADQQKLFNMAMEMYVISVNVDTADFPINIESQIRSGLDKVFGPYMPERKSSSTSTFNSFNTFDSASVPSIDLKTMESVIRREPSSDSSTTLWDRPMASPDNPRFSFEPHPGVRPLGAGTMTTALAVEKISVGGNVTRGIFNDAEASIKYLVLTNTWQKLVKAHDHLDLV
ncbi:hypothetical protein MBLNU459_g2354t1 [Dothideomycetes sp. NU459]